MPSRAPSVLATGLGETTSPNLRLCEIDSTTFQVSSRMILPVGTLHGTSQSCYPSRPSRYLPVADIPCSPYDNLSAKQCHGKPLPCSVNNTAICVSQEDANTIYRLGQWEYAYQWRFAPNAVKRSALVMGPWVGEMMGHVKDVASGKSCMKYYHK